MFKDEGVEAPSSSSSCTQKHQCWNVCTPGATPPARVSGEFSLYTSGKYAQPKTSNELKNASQLARVTHDSCTCLPSEPSPHCCAAHPWWDTVRTLQQTQHTAKHLFAVVAILLSTPFGLLKQNPSSKNSSKGMAPNSTRQVWPWCVQLQTVSLLLFMSPLCSCREADGLRHVFHLFLYISILRHLLHDNLFSFFIQRSHVIRLRRSPHISTSFVCESLLSTVDTAQPSGRGFALEPCRDLQPHRLPKSSRICLNTVPAGRSVDLIQVVAVLRA